LESATDIMSGIPFAYGFFSRLSPNSTISPHYGPCNVRLRIHLGLDIPDNCYIKVAEEKKLWEEGKCLVFDDTYLHEVKNENKEKQRVILLLDIWHPDLKSEEIQAIHTMFNSAYDKGWLKK
jgi:aspartyl/asparaginyl beta-hydroxylase (cupin superfamily)